MEIKTFISGEKILAILGYVQYAVVRSEHTCSIDMHAYVDFGKDYVYQSIWGADVDIDDKYTVKLNFGGDAVIVKMGTHQRRVPFDASTVANNVLDMMADRIVRDSRAA